MRPIFALIPEALVLATAVALLVAPHGGPRPWHRRLAAAALLLAIVALGLELWLGATVETLFAGGWVQDRFSLFAKAALLLGLITLAAGGDWKADPHREALPLAYLAVFGGMVAASAASLVGLWAGLELAALAGVAAAGVASRETGLRLLLASVVAGGLLALGFAFLYASAGATTLSGLQSTFRSQPVTLPLALAVLLALAGLAVRLSLTPFQAPFLEGGLAVAPSGSGVLGGLVVGTAVVVAAKLLAGLVGANAAWGPWLSGLGALAMITGGLRALAMRTPRGLAAWLVCGQVGWIAAGLATHDRRGSAAALFLLGALLLAASAAPALAAEAPAGEHPGPGVWGLVRREPVRAAGLALALLSLAGTPPLAGFFGEFTVSVELMRSGMAWVLAAGLLGWVLSLAAVIRVLRRLYLETSPEEYRRGPGRVNPVWISATVVPALLVLVYGLLANPIHGLAVQGAEALGLR